MLKHQNLCCLKVNTRDINQLKRQGVMFHDEQDLSHD